MNKQNNHNTHNKNINSNIISSMLSSTRFLNPDYTELKEKAKLRLLKIRLKTRTINHQKTLIKNLLQEKANFNHHIELFKLLSSAKVDINKINIEDLIHTANSGDIKKLRTLLKSGLRS